MCGRVEMGVGSLPGVEETEWARPGRALEGASVHRVPGRDRALVGTREPYAHRLNLGSPDAGDDPPRIVEPPKGKYYSLQKARIKKKELLTSSNSVAFKDNEIFFGRSGRPRRGFRKPGGRGEQEVSFSKSPAQTGDRDRRPKGELVCGPRRRTGGRSSPSPGAWQGTLRGPGAFPELIQKPFNFKRIKFVGGGELC